MDSPEDEPGRDSGTPARTSMGEAATELTIHAGVIPLTGAACGCVAVTWGDAPEQSDLRHVMCSRITVCTWWALSMPRKSASYVVSATLTAMLLEEKNWPAHDLLLRNETDRMFLYGTDVIAVRLP